MEHQINEEIRDKEVRLISNDGEQLGIVAIQKAQEIAVEKGMDLVKIAPQAKPPVQNHGLRQIPFRAGQAREGSP